MNTIDDPLKLVADLKPDMLDRLAEEGYARRRQEDLARAVAVGSRPAPATGRTHRAPGPRPGRRWRARILGIAAATAAAGLVAGLVVAASGGTHHGTAARSGTAPPPVTLTAAQQVLYRLSTAAAAAAPQPGRYVELRELDIGPTGVSSKALQEFRSRFPGGKVPPALKMYYRRLVKKVAATPAYDTVRRISVIDRRTGDTWTYQQGPGVPRELPVARHLSPTAAQFAAWPTRTAALRALLITQARQQPQGRRESTDDLVFEQAFTWLCNPLVSPGLRSALYKVLAATPGVTVRTNARDKTGQQAIEISRVDSTAREDFETFENRATGAVLESFAAGQADVYLSTTSHATLPSNPYGG